jgi:hypothetical protein
MNMISQLIGLNVQLANDCGSNPIQQFAVTPSEHSSKWKIKSTLHHSTAKPIIGIWEFG